LTGFFYHSCERSLSLISCIHNRNQPHLLAGNKVYQLLAHGWWFSTGTPVSSTPKTGCHDIAEILLKATLNTINQIKSNHFITDMIDLKITTKT
jgi:hypothetical protein